MHDNSYEENPFPIGSRYLVDMGGRIAPFTHVGIFTHTVVDQDESDWLWKIWKMWKDRNPSKLSPEELARSTGASLLGGES